MIPKDILIPLEDIDGYLASLIFNVQGDVLVLDSLADSSLNIAGENMAAIMKAMLNATSGTSLGDCQFIQINSELGILGAVWMEKNEIAIAVLLGPKGNMGLAKLALSKIAETTSFTA